MDAPSPQPTNQTDDSETRPDQIPPIDEPVWTFRGYHLKASEFNTAMSHFFRAEVSRANVWRQRLDTTTNWAVVTTGAAISIAFTQSGFHGVILVNSLLVTVFLLIEARRYRYYELWSYRVRLMETDFFSAMLVPPFHPSPEWSEALAESLLHPHFPISNLEALGRRLRRNYLYIFAIIAAAWIGKLYLYPTHTHSLSNFIERATIGSIAGGVVLIIVFIYLTFLVIVAITTTRLQQSAGEILPRFGGTVETTSIGDVVEQQSKAAGQPWFRPVYRRKQLLTLVITDRAQSVSDQIMKNMARGVTSISATGMYTGNVHQVLIVALTVTEIPQLKALVKAEDPNAFIIVSPAQEILGKGFQT